MGNEDAAPFSTFDVEETDSVTILNYLLNTKRVKSQINIRDTYPNADGFLEIVNKEQKPIGRLTVQVKKLPDDHLDEPKKTFSVKTLNYAKKISEPFILIVVDIDNEVAYWKHLSASWVQRQNLDGQVQKTIHFSKNNVIDGSNEDYIDRWRAITSRYTRERSRQSMEHEVPSKIKIEVGNKEYTGNIIGVDASINVARGDKTERHYDQIIAEGFEDCPLNGPEMVYNLNNNPIGILFASSHKDIHVINPLPTSES